MLETISANSGDISLILDGKLLASRMDPRAEAQKWVEKNYVHFLGIRSALIIGVGAGYHLIELKRQCPHLNIIGLDCHADLISHHEKSLELVRSGVRIINTDDTEIFENEAVRDALSGSYKVVVHASANITYGKSLTAIKDSLNARNREGFEALIAIRGWDKISIKNINAEVLSIMDLDFYSSQEDTDEALQMADVEPVLMELIK